MEKAIFVGLDNGGKTSIIYTLNGEFSLLSGIRPTIGVSRNQTTTMKLLGMNITHWDLGGQKKYRDKVLKEKNFVFVEAEIIFYVIDVLDDDRFPESLEYFEKIIEILDEMNEDPVIHILFHKLDPPQQSNEQLLDRITDMKNKIEQLTSGRRIAYYSTSIHDV
ncbi:MAG: hypothetical protein GF364_16895, partial [Candidatus Lokiarchaeota archaeon]|nr:hypothetical protein [Candidatus Lokiarchaeota archaeon]